MSNGIDTTVTTLESLAALYNWEPRETPLVYAHPITGELTDSKSKLIYRQNNDGSVLPLGEVGINYQLVNNAVQQTITDPDTGVKIVVRESMIEHIRPIAESGLVKISSGGELLDGRKVFTCFELTEFEPVPGDYRRGYASYFNSHDGSTGTGWVFHQKRIICQNTFRLAMSSKVQLATRHTSRVVMNLDKIRESLDLVRAQFIATSEGLAELSKIVIQDEETIKKIVKVAFSQSKFDEETSTLNRKPKVLEPVLRLFESGKGQDNPHVRGTGLALFEAVSEYLNHESGANRVKPTSEDTRFDSLLFGESRKILDKTQAAIFALR